MGMDVYGEAPKNPKGEYFRNNCWYWRPLWDFIWEECSDIITERDYQAGHYNGGHVIAAAKAERIALRLRGSMLEREILAGAFKRLLEERDAARKINQMLLAEIEAGGRAKQVVEMERDALLAALKQIMSESSADYPPEGRWFEKFDGIAFSRGSKMWEDAVAAIALVEGRK